MEGQIQVNNRRQILRSLVGMAAGTAFAASTDAAGADSIPERPSPKPTRPLPSYVVVTDNIVTPEGPVVMADGSVLVCEMLEGRVSRVAQDGTVKSLGRLGGAPNGAALGPDGACYITNSGGYNSERGANGKLEMRPGLPPDYKGGFIQRLDLRSGAASTLYSQVDGVPLHGPNDLVFDESGGFYFTDLGKFHDDVMDFGAIYWARADGGEIRKLAGRLISPNGIALSPDRHTLYVALSEKRQVIAYNITAPGQLQTNAKGAPVSRVVVSVGGNLSFDSMKVEQNGNLVVGTLQVGCLSVFSPAGVLLQQVKLPDSNVTNLAFGGRDLKTAYVTLTATGRLVAVPWPRPGLRLMYQQ